MDLKAKTFDVGATHEITILSGVEKTCTVRYPTDQQWCERSRKNRIVRKNLGRGKTLPVPFSLESVDHEIFKSILVDAKGFEFDGAEASNIISRLDFSTVDTIEKAPEGYLVKLMVFRSVTTHLIAPPTISQAMALTSAISSIDENRLRVTRVALEPYGELYDKLVKKITGYAEAGTLPVPINHKFNVVFDLIAKIEQDMAAGDDAEGADPEA